jgi:hypothetical protein
LGLDAWSDVVWSDVVWSDAVNEEIQGRELPPLYPLLAVYKKARSSLKPAEISSMLFCAPDQDEDGFGDALALLRLEQHACPSGFVDNNLDCADEDSRAFPGQTLYFTTPAIGKTIDPWDFDCDGAAEQQYPDPPLSCSAQKTETDCTQWSDDVSSHVGWAQSVPECGQSGKVTTGWGCVWTNDTCLVNVGGDRIQACR